MYRLAGTAVTEIYASKSDPPREYGWLDARTLWLSTPDSREAPENLTLQKLVDGAVVDSVSVKLADWGLEEGNPLQFAPLIMITKRGELWLSTCVQPTETERCADTLYLRADQKPFKVTRRPPKGADPSRVRWSYIPAKPLAFPKQKPPAGFTVKKAVHGITCTRPDGATSVWPRQASDEPFITRKTTWLRTVPPVLRIDGKWKETGNKAPEYVVDCRGPADAVTYFGDGIWGWREGLTEAEQDRGAERDSIWLLYRDDAQLARFDAEEIHFAPK